MEETEDHIDNVLSLQDTNVTTIKLASPSGQLIELLKFHSHPVEPKRRAMYEIGISHIALTVQNLDAEYEMLKSKGVHFNSSPQLSPDGYAKVAFCSAPEDTLIELVEVL